MSKAPTPPPATVPTVPAFIAMCEAFCERHNRPLRWLSKQLVKDTYKLEKMKAGESDIGVNVMERCVADLAQLEKDQSSGQAA